MSIKVAPSILSADFVNLERDLGRIAQADLVHVDVMDYHFVPNLTWGLPVVERIAQVSPVPLDVHLMIDEPDRWAVDYALAGAASVTFHAEACDAPFRLADALHQAGARAAIALNPATPLDGVKHLLRVVDMVLVMGVEPGFGGQSFIEPTLSKMTALRRLIDDQGLDVEIEVDGGVQRSTVADIAAAGATVLVAGSAVYGAADPSAEIAALRALAEAATAPGGRR